MQPTYVVRPDRSGDGARLTGPGIRFPLWFDDETEAARNATLRLQEAGGGRIVFTTSKRVAIITETVSTEQPRRANAGG